MRKLCAIVFAVVYLVAQFSTDVDAAFCIYDFENGISGVDEEVESFILQWIETQNQGDWYSMSEFWCDERKEIFEELLSDESFIENNYGITTVRAAELKYIYQLEADEIPVDIYTNLYVNYQNIRVYLVAVDYDVKEVTENFYNGINYRIVYLGYENGMLKILESTEATSDFISSLSDKESEMQFVSDEQNEDIQNDIDTAVEIRKARTEGYIVDSDMKIEGYISEDVNYEVDNFNEIEELEALEELNNSVSTFSLKNGYTYNTECKHRMPAYVRVHLDRTENKQAWNGAATAFVGVDDYVKDVIRNEVTIASQKTSVEVIKAMLICIKQYAVWYRVYEAKYPDLGYDLVDKSGDQNYIAGSYEALPQAYKSKVDEALPVIKYHMESGGTVNSFFVSHYAASTLGKWEGKYGYLKLDEALEMTDFTYREILRSFYNYTNQEGIGMTGTIRFGEYKYPGSK